MFFPRTKLDWKLHFQAGLCFGSSSSHFKRETISHTHLLSSYLQTTIMKMQIAVKYGLDIFSMHTLYAFCCKALISLPFSLLCLSFFLLWVNCFYWRLFTLLLDSLSFHRFSTHFSAIFLLVAGPCLLHPFPFTHCFQSTFNTLLSAIFISVTSDIIWCSMVCKVNLLCM